MCRWKAQSLCVYLPIAPIVIYKVLVTRRKIMRQIKSVSKQYDSVHTCLRIAANNKI